MFNRDAPSRHTMARSDPPRRVVITGIGIVSPLGVGAKAHWAALCAGTVGVNRITAFDPSGFASQVGGQAPPFKVGQFIPKDYRKRINVMARDIELAVVAADDAVRDAGLHTRGCLEKPTDKPDVDGSRFGCNIGAGLISVDLNELTSAMATSKDGDRLDLAQWGTVGMQQLTPLWLLKYLPNMLACHVTIIHELKGPSNTITCGDASSHLAIGEAFRTIQRGDADLAVCGGAETKVQPMGLMRQILLDRVTTQHNDDPAAAVRPFDAAAAGTAVGEGGGLFVLEEHGRAVARGATIYAEVVGFGGQPGHVPHHRARPHRRQLRPGRAERAGGCQPAANCGRPARPLRHRHRRPRPGRAERADHRFRRRAVAHPRLDAQGADRQRRRRQRRRRRRRRAGRPPRPGCRRPSTRPSRAAA